MLCKIIMNCKNLKQKVNKKLYCKKLKSDIMISECNNCKYKEYKSGYSRKSPIMNGLKKRTSKQVKLERNRYSILTNDLEHCILCGAKKDHLHEVCFGRNRANSIKYGLVIPLCSTHHTEMHRNKEWQDCWHIIAQKKFMEYYHKSVDEFIEIFKINYL